MSDMARGVDLLLAEASFVEGRDTVGGMHMTVQGWMWVRTR